MHFCVDACTSACTVSWCMRNAFVARYSWIYICIPLYKRINRGKFTRDKITFLFVEKFDRRINYVAGINVFTKILIFGREYIDFWIISLGYKLATISPKFFPFLFLFFLFENFQISTMKCRSNEGMQTCFVSLFLFFFFFLKNFDSEISESTSK